VLAVALGPITARAQDRRLPANVTIDDVVSRKERGQITEYFQKYLATIGFAVAIDKRESMIDYFKKMSSGKDWSFGAVCRVHAMHKSPCILCGTTSWSESLPCLQDGLIASCWPNSWRETVLWAAEGCS
jgi:hypothetical protein